MIPREVLERDRVLLQAQRTADQIDSELAAGRTSFNSEGVSADEARRVRDELRAALKSERSAVVNGTHSSEAYLPRSRILSNLQGIAANRLTVRVPLRSGEAVTASGEGSPLEDFIDPSLVESLRAPTSDLGEVDPITSLSVADRLNDALEPLPAAGLQAIVPYSDEDPLWLICGLAVALRDVDALLAGDREFNADPAQQQLGSESRLFLFGDWGSGTERAEKLATAITAKLNEDESRSRDCHVIHLGDTYFAGFPWEQYLHVLRLWPATTQSWATSWALPGNHDYYSGAGGYYDTLLTERRFAHQSTGGTTTSIFEIANDRWMILGLDSGYIDHDLVPVEQSWLKARLEHAERNQLGVILLSHHQPWSVFTAGPNPPWWQRALSLLRRLKAWVTRKSNTPMLWSRVQPLLADLQLQAWFWGHEHRLALYKETKEIKRPRLLGNAGVPSRLTDSRYISDESKLILDYEVPLGNTPKDKPWCRFAFAVVDLDPDGSFIENYFDEDGQPIPVPPAS